jgi:hypothetical protein
MPVSRVDLFDRLARLDLPAADFVVAGSAPLLLHGLREHIHDIDVVVRPGAWAKAERLGSVHEAPYEGAHAIYLDHGLIQILDQWFPSLWEPAELSASTDRVGAYRFLSLPATLVWKRYLHRPQDLRDAKAIESYLVRS